MKSSFRIPAAVAALALAATAAQAQELLVEDTVRITDRPVD